MGLQYSKPPETLARELAEVSRNAEAFLDQVNGANYLPASFPKDQVIFIASSLIYLPYGTAEGCRAPLEYARNKLPSLRRIYLTGEEPLPNQPHSDEPPLLVRDSVFDEKISKLIASTMTALDEYRRLAAASEDFELRLERAIPNTSDETIEDAIRLSKELDPALTKARKEVQETTTKDSSKADDLTRQLHDAQGLNRIANAELRMPTVVASWLRKLVDALRQYPTLIRDTAKALRVGVDIVELGVKQWHAFELELNKLVLSRLRKACDALYEAADKLEEYRAAQKLPGKSSRGPLNQGDDEPRFDLGEAERLIAGGELPPRSWWPLITNLDLSSAPIGTIASLARFINLESLNLRNTRIDELGPLRGLTRLRWLDVSKTRVRDLTPLMNLKRLESLDLSHTAVADISALKGIQSMTRLDVAHAPIKDWSPVAEMRSLGHLTIDSNQLGHLTIDSNQGEISSVLDKFPSILSVSVKAAR